MTPADQSRFPPVAVTLKNGATAVVRPLGAGDGEALGDFYAAVPLEDQRFYCPHPLTRERARQNAAAASSSREVVLVLAPAAGGIGGYAWYRWAEGAAKSAFGICVRRDFQGRGAGQALMARLMEIARTVGPSAMGLTVQKANARAVDLYRQMGFRVVKEQMRGPIAAVGFPPEPEYGMERAVR